MHDSICSTKSMLFKNMRSRIYELHSLGYIVVVQIFSNQTCDKKSLLPDF